MGDKLLIIRVFCPRIWDCGSKRVKVGAMWGKILHHHEKKTFRVSLELAKSALPGYQVPGSAVKKRFYYTATTVKRVD